MKITETNLKGCFVIEPTIFEDHRGLFFESYRKNELVNAIGYNVDFIQDNQSTSKKGVLRGLHFQIEEAAQAKLVQVIKGEVLDVLVDLRKESDTYREYLKLNLSAKNRKSIFIPKGMAHGFLALEDDTIFSYKCDNYYNPKKERGIIFNDPDLNINWNFPNSDFIISDKDLKLPKLANLSI